MADEDVQKIKQNLDKLVEETNLDTLIDELSERGVLTAAVIQKYKVSYLLNMKVV